MSGLCCNGVQLAASKQVFPFLLLHATATATAAELEPADEGEHRNQRWRFIDLLGLQTAISFPPPPVAGAPPTGG